MFVDIIFVVLVLALLIAIYKLKFQNASNPQQQPLIQHQPPQQPPVRAPSWATTNDAQQQMDSEEDEKVEGKVDMRKQLRKQQKAKQKQQRKQAMEHYLEQQKKKREKYDQEQEQKEKREEEKRQKEEEYYRLLAEEGEKKKQEEYNKWKDMFSVQESGIAKQTPEEEERKKLQFRNTLSNHLKRSKLSLLEDLSHKFKLSTKEMVEKIKQLQELGMIDGIFDERGKYLVIESKEWQGIKNYMAARGRVKKTDIMQECAKIIKIPEKTEVEQEILNLIEEER